MEFVYTWENRRICRFAGNIWMPFCKNAGEWEEYRNMCLLFGTDMVYCRGESMQEEKTCFIHTCPAIPEKESKTYYLNMT